MSGTITHENVPDFLNEIVRASEELRVKKEKLTIGIGDKLELTDWKCERPNLVLDFSSTLRKSQESSLSWVNIPGKSQEHIVVDELLKVLCGGESDFILLSAIPDKFGRCEFTVHSEIDKLNAEFVKKCLPMASYFSVVSRFVEDNVRLCCGRVNQALAGGMDEKLSEHQRFIEALQCKHRQNKINPHELWYHVQDNFSKLRVLYEIAMDISTKKMRGSLTLSYLHDRLKAMIVPLTVQMGIVSFLLTVSAVPYMESVKQWIFNGKIYDPFDEFMVVENKSRIKNSNLEGYWEMMYQLRPQLVPSFLESSQYYILNAGKYLNVVRECVKSEKELNLAPITDIIYSDEKSYNDVIMGAYKHASKILLNFMLNEFSLMDRITCAKKYFLLQQGDFVVQLLDTCNEELRKSIDDVVPSRLAALVELAIGVSSVKSEPWAEKITSCLKPVSLGSQIKKILVDCIPGKPKDEQDSVQSIHDEGLMGFESFTLAMKYEWPVSIIFNMKVQSVYQLLFRHLFYCRYIESILNNAWVIGQSTRSTYYSDRGVYFMAISVRHRMHFFLENMERYMMEDIIEPAWEELMDVIKTCESVDDLMKFHWDFLEKCTQDCLLTNIELFTLFGQILSICRELGETLVTTKKLTNSTDLEEFSELICALDKSFSENLLLFLRAVSKLAECDSSGKLLNLICKQNYNNFYNEYSTLH